MILAHHYNYIISPEKFGTPKICDYFLNKQTCYVLTYMVAAAKAKNTYLYSTRYLLVAFKKDGCTTCKKSIELVFLEKEQVEP